VFLDVPVYYYAQVSHNFVGNSGRWVAIYGGVHHHHYPVADLIKEVFFLLFPNI
jgi:hypothetical protein